MENLLEKNLIHHLTYLPSRTEGMEVVETEELVIVDSGIASDTFNVIAHTRFSNEVAHERVEETVQRFSSRQLPFAWWVDPHATPEGLPCILSEHGLVGEEPDIGMVADLAGAELEPQPPEGLTITKVDSPELLADAARILGMVMECQEECESYYTQVAPALLTADAPYQLFVATFKGRTVTTGSITYTDSVAGLYDVATHPSWRRRGFGTAMMRHLMAEAQNANASHAMLQASEAGISVYKELGFREFCAYRTYVPKETSN